MHRRSNRFLGSNNRRIQNACDRIHSLSNNARRLPKVTPDFAGQAYVLIPVADGWIQASLSAVVRY
jgi:hypothetical protein